MPVFPSQEWCEQVIAALQADPETIQAGLGWTGDVAAAVLPAPPHLPEGFAVYANPVGSEIREFRVLEDLDEIEELEPAYVVRADLLTWRQLLEGRLDPIEAVLNRKVRFEGDLQPVIERAHFKDVLRRALAKVSTTFVGEPG